MAQFLEFELLYVVLTLVNVQLVVCVPLPPAAHSEMLLPSSYSWPPCCISERKKMPDKGRHVSIVR